MACLSMSPFSSSAALNSFAKKSSGDIALCIPSRSAITRSTLRLYSSSERADFICSLKNACAVDGNPVNAARSPDCAATSVDRYELADADADPPRNPSVNDSIEENVPFMKSSDDLTVLLYFSPAAEASCILAFSSCKAQTRFCVSLSKGSSASSSVSR